MACLNCALILPLYLIIWLCPCGSAQQDVSCWWNKVTSVDQSVSVECRADPPSFLQRCGGCKLHLFTSEQTTQASLHQCSRNTASFTTLLTPAALRRVKCELTCPGQTQRNCIIKEAYPPPTCLIPADDEGDLHCHWTRIHNPSNPTNFTLYWGELSESKYHSIKVGDSDSAVIGRAEYPSHDDVKVWISAVSALGSAKSEEIIFNTGFIREPLPPFFTNHTSDPFEMFWNTKDVDYGGRVSKCEVRYRNEYDLDWIEVEDLYETSFVLPDPEPFTKYIFHVRCGYFGDFGEQIPLSSWSAYTAQTPAAAPVGKLDVWSDCEASSDVQSCTILWKEMPKVQARGLINSYTVRVKLNNGSELNRTGFYEHHEMAVNRRGQIKSNLSCHLKQDQCCYQYSHLGVPIWEVQELCVTANSPQGESSPALVALPRTGLPLRDVFLKVTGESRYLNVCWSSPPQFTELIQEYVVQHKPIGLLHSSCLNWVKVHKSQNSVTLTGEFWNYTAYNVSLFAVVDNSSYLLQSAVGYPIEGVPPKVTDLGVTAVSSSSVVLTWKPIPLTARRGVILKYSVGLSNHTVLNVSGDENSVQVSKLNPGQQYEAWISAVTAAGEGERTTTKFTTVTTDNIALIVLIVVLLCVIAPILFFILFLRSSSWREKMLWLKIPDPINSSLFQQKNLFRQSWLLSHNPSEYMLTFSPVVVLPVSQREEEEEEQIVELPEEEQQTEDDRQEAEKEPQKSGRLERIDSMTRRKTKDYSHVIDTSEEEASRGYEDDDEEWEEQCSPSDYEKHFMPSVDV